MGNSGAVISTERYAAAIAGLDLAQQRAVLSARELNKAQQESVVAMIKAAAAAESLSLKDAAEAARLSEAKLATYLEIELTDKLTASKLLAALAEGRLTQEQYDSIIAKGQSIVANKALGKSYDELTLKQKLAAGAAAMTPMGWVTLVLSILPLVITGVTKLYDWLTVTAEEARETADELHAIFEETANELENVNSELETSRDRLAELLKLSESGTISIVEQEELDDLKEEIGLLEQRERLLKAQKEREAKESNEALEDAFNKKSFNPDLYVYATDGLKQELDELEKTRKGWTDADKARYDELMSLTRNIGEAADRGRFDAISGMMMGQSMGYADYIKMLTARYNELDGIAEKTASDLYEMGSLETRLGELGVSLSDFIAQYEGDSETKAFWQELVDLIDCTINKAELFTKKVEELPDTVKDKLTDRGATGNLTAGEVEGLANDYPELKQAMDDSGLTAEMVAEHFNSLSAAQDKAGSSADGMRGDMAKLSDVLSDLKSSYDLLETARNDMAGGGGLSTETIQKLAETEENYLDFLYEENGVIKLNIAAFEEKAQAMARSDVVKLQQNIESINRENEALRENIRLYEDLRTQGDPNGEYAKKIAQAMAEMDKNAESVEDFQKQIAVLGYTLDQVADKGTDAAKSLTDALSSITEQYDLLTKAQEEHSQSGALSASTLSSIVSKYPELQQSVDLYIAGLKTERGLLDDLSAAYDVDLKNYQDAIVLKMESSAAFYNSLGSNQKQLINELGRAYGVDLQNFKTIEEKKLAIQAAIISQLAENYSKYSGATLEDLKGQYAQLGGRADSSAAASKERDAVGAAISRIESAYKKIRDIASGSGLITSFNPSRFKGSSSGSSGESGKKEIEEYTAAINQYREAEERLRKARESRERVSYNIDNSDNLKEQILLEHQLIGAYKQEQEALHSLNNQRDGTIAAGVKSLRELGFAVQYNADTNELWIENMDRLNELTASSKGKYGSLQEATNALRQDTEGLIETLTDLNNANRDGSNSWWELKSSIREAKIAIIDDLKQIVTDASDAVDEIQNVYDTLKAAADEYAEDGFISVDAYQSIIELGPQYMQYLRDENGLLVINEESINRVIAAKTRQLAAEQALTYVERLRLALQSGSIENLNTLLYATTEATDATFGLAYAELALMHSLGDLDDQQYAAALHNIQAIESLANTAIASIGRVAGESSEKLRQELEKMKSGVDDILKYVMDMLKHRIQQQIDALEDLKDAYGDIIDLRKEALDAAKKEAEYEDKVAEKVKQIAKLQERINALSLDDSRDAQAQKIKLEEELAELQKELADDQNDYAVDAQKDALDDMKEAYEDEKDAEIKALEETISSYQKLYDMAISYIQIHWETLYGELISWNTEYGSVLNSEITEAWNNCLAAAQRYGSYISALQNIGSDIDAAGSSSGYGSSNNVIVGDSGKPSQPTREDNIRAITNRMKRNSQEWHTASTERKQYLDADNFRLGTVDLAKYGIRAVRGADGTWYLDRIGGRKLYDVYHKGGIVGNSPTLKQNEVLSVLEKGEAVLDEQKERGLYRLVEFATVLSDKFSELIRSSGLSSVLTGPGGLAGVKPDAPSNVTNSEKVSIEFGDTIIYGANEGTVEQHRAITRQQANELLDKLNIKR